VLPIALILIALADFVVTLSIKSQRIQIGTSLGKDILSLLICIFDPSKTYLLSKKAV
jgi:hypothetical protein